MPSRWRRRLSVKRSSSLNLRAVVAGRARRQRRVQAQRCASPWRSALRSDFPAMLGQPGLRRTRYALFERCAQTAATSQSTKRVSFGTRARLPCASRRRGGALRWARTRLCGAERAGIDAWCTTAASTRQAVSGRGDFRDGEKVSPDTNSPCGLFVPGERLSLRLSAACKARPGLGARSALQHLTHRSCLSAAAAGRVASSAVQAPAEHHSGVEAQRRPPRYEPLPDTACRSAPPPHTSEQ